MNLNDTIIMQCDDYTYFNLAIRQLVNLTASWDEFNEGLPIGTDAEETLLYLVNNCLPVLPESKRKYLIKVIKETGASFEDLDTVDMKTLMSYALFCGFDWEDKVELDPNVCFPGAMKLEVVNQCFVNASTTRESSLIPLDAFDLDEFVKNNAKTIQDCSIEFQLGYHWRLSMPGYLDCTDWSGPFDSYEEAFKDAVSNYGEGID